MDRYTKYPHIFKIDSIISKQKVNREHMLKEYEQVAKRRKILRERQKMLSTQSFKIMSASTKNKDLKH